jgi:addiction module antitoxin, RelB/DinJ family
MTAMTKKTRARKEPIKSAKAVIQVRVDAKTKSRAEKLFKRFGMSTNDGIRIFLDAVIKEKALPFDPGASHIPNAKTVKAIEEGLAEKLEPVTLAGLRKIWDEA